MRVLSQGLSMVWLSEFQSVGPCRLGNWVKSSRARLNYQRVTLASLWQSRLRGPGGLDWTASWQGHRGGECVEFAGATALAHL